MNHFDLGLASVVALYAILLYMVVDSVFMLIQRKKAKEELKRLREIFCEDQKQTKCQKKPEEFKGNWRLTRKAEAALQAQKKKKGERM